MSLHQVCSLIIALTLCATCFSLYPNPAGNYMFKVNNRNTRTKCEVCSKLTIKTPERRHCAIGVVLVSLLLPLNIFHTLLKQMTAGKLPLVFTSKLQRSNEEMKINSKINLQVTMSSIGYIMNWLVWSLFIHRPEYIEYDIESRIWH